MHVIILGSKELYVCVRTMSTYWEPGSLLCQTHGWRWCPTSKKVENTLAGRHVTQGREEACGEAASARRPRSCPSWTPSWYVASGANPGSSSPMTYWQQPREPRCTMSSTMRKETLAREVKTFVGQCIPGTWGRDLSQERMCNTWCHFPRMAWGLIYCAAGSACSTIDTFDLEYGL
jgi:hypothetical protein